MVSAGDKITAGAALIAGFLSLWIFLFLPADTLPPANRAQVVLFISVTVAIFLQDSGIHYPAPARKQMIMILCIMLLVVFAIRWRIDSPATDWWGLGIILTGHGYSVVYPFFCKR